MTVLNKLSRCGRWLWAMIGVSVLVGVMAVLLVRLGALPPDTLRVGSFPTEASQGWQFFDLVVSPDGRYVAFRAIPSYPTSDRALNSGRLVIIPLQATVSTPMWVETRSGILSAPTWCPDGSSLAFAALSYGSEGSCIMVCDLQTRQLRMITAFGKQRLDDTPVWSPTAEWIAFERGRFIRSSSVSWFGCDLWIVRPDGSGLRQVTSDGLVLAHRGSQWSPDGARLYYIRRSSRHVYYGDVWVASINKPNTPPRALTRGLKVSEMTVSPDGRYLLCNVRLEPFEPATDICVVPVANPERADVVLHQPLGSMAQFGPRSDEIVYTWESGRRATRSLWKKALSGRPTKIKLVDTVAGLALRNAWTVGGQIVFTRNNHTSIWIVNDDGTNEREVFRLQN